MVASQNGWRANDRSVIASYDLPGGKIALRRGSVGQVIAWVGRRWHTEVEGLLWPGCWGYAERPIRGGVQLSNHASGTAADWCAPRHPLGTAPAANFSGPQIAAVRRIMADTAVDGRPLIRWGGDYVGRKDGMHVEADDGTTEAQFDRLWARLSGAPTTPTPAPPPPAGAALATLRYGMQGDERVRRLQAFLNRYAWKPPLPLLPTTGNYLDQTAAVVRQAQAQCGVTGPDADGTIVGPRTSSAFAARGASW